MDPFSTIIDNPWSMVIALVVMLTYVVVTYRFFTIARQRKNREEQRFFKALDAGFETGAITSLDDVVNLYKGIKGLTSEDLAYRSGLSNRLRQYFVQVIENEMSDLNVDGTQLKDLIARFVDDNDTESPYADLPDLERNILADISTYLEIGNVAALQRKVEELSSAIQARANDFTRIEAINRWSVPLAAIGLVLTVLFGILSFAT